MKKGFTLVEMLIVVVVLVTLMTMTFRLSSVGSSSKARNRTINRMQRLENCLSGYYAAYGSYPAVKLHGSRNIYLSVNDAGIQDEDGQENRDIWGWYTDKSSHGIGTSEEAKAWDQVKAACKSQPLAFRFPFPSQSSWDQMIEAVSDALKENAEEQSGISESRRHVLKMGFSNMKNFGALDKSATDWREVQIFQFGLMSYLLPRYMVCMNGEETLFTDGYAQWTSNNGQAYDPFTDEAVSWSKVYEWAQEVTKENPDRDKLCHIENMPSQAVTARWLPNLEEALSCNYGFRLFGIDVKDPESSTSELRADNYEIEVFSTSGSGSGGTYYVLDSVTVMDGWGNEFYYYSPPPHQSYTLWSAGPNGRTFPPWISRKTLDGTANRCVAAWTEDDIVKMSN